MPDTLGSIAVEFLGNMSRLKSDMDRAFDAGISQGRRAGEQTGDAFVEGVRSGIRSLASGGGIGGIVGSITGGSLRATVGAGILREVAAVGAAASNAATTVAGYRKQLSNIAQDAKKGEEALASLSQTARDSEFNKQQVMQIGTVIAGRTGDVGRASRETQKLVDAGAKLGINNSTFDAYQTNIAQILAKEKGKLDAEDVRQLRTAAPAIALEISRAQGISMDDANKMLDTGTGRQLYDALLKVGEVAKGEARKAASGTPQGVLSNMGEDGEAFLAATGARINQLILKPLVAIQTVTGKVAEFNEATGGSAGMVAMIGLGTLAIKLLVDGGRKAWAGVVTLTGAIERLAAMSDVAAISVNRQAAAQTVANVGGNLATVTQGAAAVAGAGAARGGLASGLAGASRFVAGAKGIAAFGIPVALSYAGQQMAQSNDPAKSWAGGTLQAAGTGALIGGAIGSVIPVVGNLAGAAIGAVVGAVVDTGQRLYEQNQKKDTDKGTSAEERTAKATEKTASAVEKLSFKLVGGGQSGREAASALEREYSVHALMRVGVTGF